ncbi:MAG: hypothetical protein ACI8QC_004152 [Planctomycetota bacterium]|jgi:hypothetical protein
MTARTRTLIRVLSRLFWCVLILEVGCFFAVWTIAGVRPGYANQSERAADIALAGQPNAAGEVDTRRFDQVRHPYMGYVAKPLARGVRRGLSMLSSMDMGDPNAPIYDPDVLLIGITGGSVAAGVFNAGGAALLKRLRTAPQFKGRELHLFGFAAAGFKQPQQAVALAYLLSAGVQFDAVINLDGFNEVALVSDPGLKRGGFPAYPYSWSSRVALTGTQLDLAGELAYLKRGRTEAAIALTECPGRFAWMRQFAWELSDWRTRIELRGTRELLVASQLKAAEPMESFEQLGPRIEGMENSDRLPELVAIWERSAAVMQGLCESSDAIYLPALQPNQYDPEFVKPMLRAEQRVARSTGSMFAVPAARGYPLLHAAAERLEQAGISVLDLKAIFADVEEVRMRDDCCHFNRAGNVALAEALADALLARGFGS